jgi:primosomal protein N' (replication factor Y)
VCAARHDVKGFVERELEARRELGYPPFSRLALLRCDAILEPRALEAATRLAAAARRAGGPAVRVLGPAPAPIARLRNRFRFHVLLRSVERTDLKKALLAVARTEVDRHVRVAIDVDPVNML